MSGMIDCSYLTGRYRALPGNLAAGRAAAWTSGFLDMAAKAGRDAADVPETGGKPEVSETAEASDVDAYLEHLKKKYGRVTIESVGRDQESLEKAGRRMRDNDVVIAPNILEDMAGDPKKALYYEQKIDYFFHTVIPQGNAICAARGLVFEPCGVVVHEDGSVTYIGGCADSPERVAQVNAINKAKREKQAAEREAAFTRSQAATNMRRELMERRLFERAISVSLMEGIAPEGGHLL